MIKNLRNIILVLVVLLVVAGSSGFKVFVHHCNAMSHTEISFFKTQTDGCCLSEIDNAFQYSEKLTSPSCCRNLSLDFIIEDFHTASFVTIAFNLFQTTAFNINCELIDSIFSSEKNFASKGKAPPLLHSARQFLFKIKSLKIPHSDC